MSSRLRAFLFGAVLCFPAAAYAQDSTAVEEIIVTASRNPDEPPIVAAARERLSETPGAVAVVSAEAYKDRYAPTLADSLRDVPGVYAQKKWGDDIRLSIRGSGIGNNAHNRGILLAQDGVPFNEADGYGDFQLIDPLTARYTEVYKGGNAVRFGGALLGGAVNLVSPTGLSAGFEELARLEVGTYETYRLHLATARAGERWDGFAAVTGMDAEGFRDHSATSSLRFTGNVGRTFGEEREVRLYFAAADLTQEIPGALTLTQLLADPTQSQAAVRDVPGGLHSQRNMMALRSSLQTRWRVSEGLLFEGGAYAIWKDLDHPIFQVIDQQGRNYGLFGRFDWEGELAGKQADAFFGAWYRTGDLDARQWTNNRSNRVGAMPTAFSYQDSKAADLFAEGRLWVSDDVAVIAGGNFGRAERDFRQVIGTAPSDSRDFDWFAPRIGLMWQAENGAQAYANLTRSVEPPNMSALAQVGPGNTPVFQRLDAQEATTAEIGARGRRGAFTWDIAVYRAEVDNELLTFTPGANVLAATFNADKTLHQGLEAALDWRITERLRLRQTYGWADFVFKSDVKPGDSLDGNRLPVMPEHQYRAELKYSHPDGWFVAPSVEWVPSGPFVDYANTVRSPAYAVLSLNAGLDFRPGVRLFIDVRNLTDEVYVSNVNGVVKASVDPITQKPSDTDLIYWPGEGRSLFVGLSAEF